MHVATCEKCDQKYYWYETSANLEGCKDSEYIICPYCYHEKQGPWVTSGYFMTEPLVSNLGRYQ